MGGRCRRRGQWKIQHAPERFQHGNRGWQPRAALVARPGSDHGGISGPGFPCRQRRFPEKQRHCGAMAAQLQRAQSGVALRPGARYRLRYTIDPGRTPDDRRRRLRLRLGHPEQAGRFRQPLRRQRKTKRRGPASTRPQARRSPARRSSIRGRQCGALRPVELRTARVRRRRPDLPRYATRQTGRYSLGNELHAEAGLAAGAASRLHRQSIQYRLEQVRPHRDFAYAAQDFLTREKIVKSNPNRFRLSPRGAMIAIVSAAFSNPALANTGKVDFAIGNITVTGADGRGRPLTKGAEVKSGDKIVSSVDGRAQIRFSDGAYVSLQPNTEFDIRQYRYSGKTDGTESALFGLFKGAMRTVTGLVGRANKNRYQITTTTATIGIRGTGGLIAIGADGSTLVTGTSGIWTLTNKGGTIDIPAGTAGLAGANVNVPPKPVDGIPVVPPPQSGPQQILPTIVQGDVVRTAGNAVSIRPSSGPGRAVAFFGAGGVNNSIIGG